MRRHIAYSGCCLEPELSRLCRHFAHAGLGAERISFDLESGEVNLLDTRYWQRPEVRQRCVGRARCAGQDSDSSGGGAQHGARLAHSACRPLLPPRPQVIESIFYMWRATHDRKWRDMGWKMWRAIDTHARWEGGYSGALDVAQVRRGVACSEPAGALQPCPTA